MKTEDKNLGRSSESSMTARDEKGRFLTGNNGGGRPKGSRSKLGEEFIQALQVCWKSILRGTVFGDVGKHNDGCHDPKAGD
jgi:hypothetical protein